MNKLLLLFTLLIPGLYYGQNKPKIVIGIVVDQMRFDYLDRFNANFSKNGFNTFIKKGTNCTNVNYNYVPTYTGPGHATIYTGTTPRNHGIIANDWFDRTKLDLINCVEDNGVLTIGSTSLEGQFSPKNLLTSTITDQLKLSNRLSKVISLSIKNRGAILPGGHLSDGSYWYDYATGKFITSSYYKKSLPNWLSKFNDKNNANSCIKDWTLLYDSSKYIADDNSSYEVVLDGNSKPCFPYEFTKMPNTSQVFPISPQANTLLTNLAMEAIKHEELGKDDETDFLAISYSSTDIVGHLFGTDSREVEDMYYRLDQDLSNLLDYLNREIGKKNYVVFLTADHGAVPVPQSLLDEGIPGGYFFIENKIKVLNQKLAIEFETSDTLINKLINNQLYYDWEVIEKNSVDLTKLNNFVKNEIYNWEGIKEVYSSNEIEHKFLDGFGNLIYNGFLKNRSGDVAFILKYGFLSKSTDSKFNRKGTSHGSPYNYDTHVPLLWYGSGIKKQTIKKPYKITHIAATIAQLLNIQTAGSSEAEPIIEILER